MLLYNTLGITQQEVPLVEITDQISLWLSTSYLQ